jgi:DNA-binding transcriptional MerR regulator
VKKLSDSVRSDLETGVSLTRLAQIADVAASTLRNYEKEGLLESASVSGKKLYMTSALDSALEVKRLRDSGLSLKEIAAQRGGTPEPVPAVETSVSTAPNAEDLKVRIEALREQLAGEKAKLEALVARVGTRQMQRNELALTKKELEEIQRLRESNVRRALEVTRRASAVSGQIQYSLARPGILRMKTPMASRKRK